MQAGTIASWGARRYHKSSDDGGSSLVRILMGKGRPTQPAGARRLGLAWRGWSLLALGLVAALGLGLALQPAAPVQGAPLAPDFTLPAATGSAPSLSLRALRGHAVLLNFF